MSFQDYFLRDVEWKYQTCDKCGGRLHKSEWQHPLCTCNKEGE